MEERFLALENLQQGVAARDRGDLPGAKELLEKSCNLFLLMEDAPHLADVYARLGELNQLTKNPLQAFDCYEKAGEYAALAFHRAGEALADSLQRRALLYVEAGKRLEAYLLLKHALSLYALTASPQAKDIKTAISRLESRFGPQQAGTLEQCWQSYQQALDQAAQQQLRSAPLNVST